MVEKPEGVTQLLPKLITQLLPKLMSGHVIAYAGDLNFYHNIQRCPILFKKRKGELNSNMHNGFKLSKTIYISLMWSWLD